MIITSAFDKGLHSLKITIIREGREYTLGNLKITRQEGKSAYLLDVKYTLNDSEALFEYPVIRLSDNKGNQNDSVDTRVYFDGIDYNGTDILGNEHYRINGRVSDIILESYAPRFTLPAGSTIQRFTGTINESDTEAQVNAKYENADNWTEETIYGDPTKVGNGTYDYNLQTNFVGLDDLLKIITYRITSEDRNQNVYYHVTATDIDHILTLKFKIYFQFTRNNLNGRVAGEIIDANHADSPIKNQVVLISQQNLKMRDLDEGEPLDKFLTNNYGLLVTDFPEIVETDIVGINNQSTLFYYIGDAANPLNINYQFGRNSTGIYNFNVVTPKYVGASTSVVHGGNTYLITNGQRYHYEMFIMAYGGSDYFNPTNDAIYHLPWMKNLGLDRNGTYFAVSSPSTNLITREIAIVVKESTQDNWWGLYDDYTSWD